MRTYNVGVMKPMQNTIAPRTPLTVTELETLATMLDHGTETIGRARTETGAYVWPQGSVLSDIYAEIFGGFYEIRENTAGMVCGDRMPWDTAEGQIRIQG